MSPADPDDRDDPAGHPADAAAESVTGSAGEAVTGSAGESVAGSAEMSAAFDEIVAAWRAEGQVPIWPVDTLGGTTRHSPPALGSDRPVSRPGDHPMPPAADGPAPGRHLLPPRSYVPLPAEDDHFVPPEPPPLPRIGRTAAVGMGLIALGLTLLLAPGLLGVAESVGLTLGLLTVAGGLGWLVLGSWSSDPPADDYDDDDGAVF
jgi:hypothetical protein